MFILEKTLINDQYDPPLPKKKSTKISGVFEVNFCSICSSLGNTDTLKIHLYTNHLNF